VYLAWHAHFESNHTCSAVWQLRIEVLKRTTCSLNTELAGDRFRVDNYVDLFRQQKGKRRKHVDESFRVHCINSVVEKKKARAGQAYLRAVDAEINPCIVYKWVKKEMDSYADAMCRCTSDTPTVLGVASDAARLGADPPIDTLMFHFVLPELHVGIVPKPQETAATQYAHHDNRRMSATCTHRET
jgi:hypothetical protein